MTWNERPFYNEPTFWANLILLAPPLFLTLEELIHSSNTEHLLCARDKHLCVEIVY